MEKCRYFTLRSDQCVCGLDNASVKGAKVANVISSNSGPYFMCIPGEIACNSKEYAYATTDQKASEIIAQEQKGGCTQYTP